MNCRLKAVPVSCPLCGFPSKYGSDSFGSLTFIVLLLGLVVIVVSDIRACGRVNAVLILQIISSMSSSNVLLSTMPFSISCWSNCFSISLFRDAIVARLFSNQLRYDSNFTLIAGVVFSS